MRIVEEWADMPLSAEDTWENRSAMFDAKASGKCYIAFKARRHMAASELNVRDINISMTDVAKSVPGKVENVTVTPAAGGELSATLTFRMPVVDATGNNLPSKPLTATVMTGAESKKAEALPGEEVNVTVKTENGFNDFKIFASNDGDGLMIVERAYCGLDIPTPLLRLGVTPSEDFKSMHLEWEAPLTGVNGGYVNPDDVEYYLCKEGTYGWEIDRLLGKNLTFDYTPAIDGQMQLAQVGILTANSVGNSGKLIVNGCVLGTPYTLPMAETLNQWSTALNPYVTEYPDESYDMYDYFYNDGNAYPYYVDVPSPYGNDAFTYQNRSGNPSKSRLALPPFSTEGVNSATLVLPVYCAPNTGEIQVYAYCHGQDNVLLGSFADNSFTGWKKMIVEIPASMYGKKWVKLCIDGLTDAEHNVVGFTNYAVRQLTDKDLALTGVSVPAYPGLGEVATLTATVENQGRNAMEIPAVTCSVIKDGEVIDAIEMKCEANEPLASYDNAVVTAEWTPDGGAVGVLEFKFEITASDDDKENNTLSSFAECAVSGNVAVTDLKGQRDDAGATLHWTEPSLNDRRQDFESFPAFSYPDNLAGFTCVDRDGLELNYFSYYSFPNQYLPKAWQVMSETGFDEAAAESGIANEFMHAYDGDKCLMAIVPFTPYVGGGENADDWLISPEVMPGSTFSFRMRGSFKGQVEYAEVLCAKEGVNPDEFELMESLTIISNEWKLYEYQLPEGYTRFAIRYTGNCNEECFAIGVDDIAFEPAGGVRELNGYDVLRDGNVIAEAVAARGAWSDASVPNEATYYQVVPVLRNGETVSRGVVSNKAYISTVGIGEISSVVSVVPMSGAIVVRGAEGCPVRVTGADGIVVADIRKAVFDQRIALRGGVYIVEVAGKTFKVTVR